MIKAKDEHAVRAGHFYPGVFWIGKKEDVRHTGKWWKRGEVT